MGDETNANPQADTVTDKGVDGHGGQPLPAAEAKQAGTEQPAAGTADAKAPEAAKPIAPVSDVATPADYGLQGPAELTGGYAETAHKLGLTKAQAQGLQGWWEGQLNEAAQMHQRSRDDATMALTKEWGGEFKTNLALAGRTLDRFGSPELKAALNSSGMGNNPDLIRLLHRVGALLSEDKLVLGGLGGGETKSAADVLYPSK